MKKIFHLTMGIMLMMSLVEAAQPRPTVNPLVDKVAEKLVGLNCDKKLRDPMSCMACQVYFESRGESARGQLAVAKVTLKRANGNSKYVCAKVYEKKKKTCQFSWACDGRSHVMTDAKAVRKAVRIARQAFAEGPDRFDHFYADYIPQPYWAKKMSCQQIGRHIFCDGVEVAGYKKVPQTVRSIAVAGL